MLRKLTLWLLLARLYVLGVRSRLLYKKAVRWQRKVQRFEQLREELTERVMRLGTELHQARQKQI